MYQVIIKAKHFREATSNDDETNSPLALALKEEFTMYPIEVSETRCWIGKQEYTHDWTKYGVKYKYLPDGLTVDQMIKLVKKGHPVENYTVTINFAWS
jgi:hypothetical protein